MCSNQEIFTVLQLVLEKSLWNYSCSNEH